MKVVPVGGHLIVEPIAAPGETPAGIVLPEPARDSVKQGRILSVGQGTLQPNGLRQMFQVHEGDRVLFADFAGTEIDLDGKELLIMNESDVMAVLT